MAAPIAIRLAGIKLWLPDESLPDFWFAHDLARTFGVHYNAEAVTKLKAALKKTSPKVRVRIDHEADAVSAHAHSAAAMHAVLRALEVAAGRALFTTKTLRAALTRMQKHKRPKAKTFAVGDIAAIRLRDGSFGAVQVAAIKKIEGDKSGEPLVLLLDARAPTAIKAATKLSRPVAGCYLLGVAFEKGEWPIMSSRAVTKVDLPRLKRKCALESSSDGLMVDLADAFFGLSAWDGMYECDYFYSDLLKNVAPPKPLLRRVIFRRAVRARFGASPLGPRTGAAVAHLTMAYPEPGRPARRTKTKLDQLTEKIEPLVMNSELYRGGGGGFLDLFFRVKEVQRARAALAEALSEMKLVAVTRVKWVPPFALDCLGEPNA